MSHQFAGRLRASLGRPGLDLAETSYIGGQRIARHVHERPLMVFVMRGAMREHVNGRSVDCRAGTALFHPAGEAHAHRFGNTGSRCLVLQFGREWFDRLGVEPGLVPDGPTSRLNEMVTSAGRLLHQEFRRGEAAHPAALDGLTLALLAAVARNDEPRKVTQQAGFLDSVLERLHDDLSADTDLASLAEIGGVSPEHLARAFRDEHGCTIGEYVRRLRVQRARRALEEGDLPLSRLALSLGFYDQSHFTRTFKAHVGCSPGAYRRRFRSMRE